MKVLFLCVLLSWLFGACTNSRKLSESLLQSSLLQAEENAKELKLVLKHYKDDLQKRKAAEFLIANMYDQVSLDSTSVSNAQPYYDFLAEYVEKNGKYKDSRIYYYFCDSLQKIFPRSTRYIAEYYRLDPTFLTARFLINHIDNCFDVWQNASWKNQISFNTFCNYILPYKCYYDYWDGSSVFFQKKYKDTLSYYKDSSFVQAGKYLDAIVKNEFQQDAPFFYEFPFMTPTMSRNFTMSLVGTCIEANIVAISALRSFGIPATLNFIPYWGNSNAGHHWTEIIGENRSERYNNQQLPSPEDREDIVNSMFWMKFDCKTIDGIPEQVQIRTCRTVPKVYRNNYAIQLGSLASIASSEEIPHLFADKGMEDVTDSYVECSDIKIPLQRVTEFNRHVYLCCYEPDGLSWTPVAWGEIRKGEARFKKVGKNIVYLPAFYANGMIIPAGDAFLLTNEGKVVPLNGSDEVYSEITLYNKVPFRNHCLYYSYVMLGNRFLAANSIDLADTVSLHTIDKIPFYGQEVIVDNVRPSRYGIYRFDLRRPVFIAELEFWGIDENGDEVPLQGKPFGNPGLFGNTLREMIDGDRVSFFYGAHDDVNYVGLDFGKPYQITRIKYNPRSDDNNIVPGELYELYYWTIDGWKSLGRQKGRDDKTLRYSNIPKNLLLRLHNHTRGKENRIFIYENDKQIYY